MPLRDYLQHNLWLKLFSLFLAALIWFSARFYAGDEIQSAGKALRPVVTDRKSTRLNSSHRCISYAVFCLKKKTRLQVIDRPSDKYALVLTGAANFRRAAPFP